jgi:ribonuclease HI
MTEFTDLCAAAYHGERVASRRLARRTGISEAAALKNTLEHAAGSAGLAALLGERAVLRADVARSHAERAERKRQTAMQRAARHDGASTPWRAWFDGSAHPNPGHCGIGALLLGPEGERIAISQAVGYGNSSEAEYFALIAVLEAARDAGARGLTLYGDSQVVINDVSGDDASAAPSLSALRATARALIDLLGGPALRWIPRHKNAEADALSQQAVAATASQASSQHPEG